MISRLTGKIALANEGRLIIDVAGVGYEVKVPRATTAGSRSGEQISLWTHLSVRENALELFGFTDLDQLGFFEQLLTVSGIGPRSALSIFNLAPMDELKRGIMAGDASYLTKVSGIGRKTAQKIILELREKIGALPDIAIGHSSTDSDVLDALTALGYSTAEARDTLRALPSDLQDTNTKIKTALRILGRR